MIKAVIFDLGGVYFTNGTVIAVNTLENMLDVPKRIIFRFFASEQGKEGYLYRLGKISEMEFWSRAAKDMNISPKDLPKIREIWHSSYRPIDGMRQLVRDVRKRYKVFVFSGSIKERIDYLSKKYGLDKEFDDYIYSFELGLGKLDINTYKAMMKRLDLKPDEFIFIDDHARFLEIAKKLGIKTILFKNVEQTRRDLIKMGIEIE